MAGIRGNSAWLLFQKQTAKGSVPTVEAAKAVKSPYSAGAIGPTREIGTLAETDANRDQGVAYVKTSGVKGNPEIYVRDAGIASLLFAVLGADSVVEKPTKFEGEIKAGTLSTIKAVASFTNIVVGAEVIDTAKTKITAGTTITAFDETAKTITLSAPASGEVVKGANNFEVFNYEHKLTPANSLAYYTFWSLLGAGAGNNVELFEQHQDCFVSDLDIKATAGSPLTAQATILGVKSTRFKLESEVANASTVPLQSGTVYNFNNGEIELAGGASALVASMNLNISNNVVAQQTDAVTPLDVAVGKRTVGITFDLIFESLTEYNKFQYGAAEGTTISSEIYKTSANFKYKLGANNSINFKIPSLAYEEFPISPEVNGAPIVVAVKGVAQRNAGNIVEATVLNQVKTY